MLVFHIDARTRQFRGRSSSGALPPSRRRGLRRSIRASIPANAVINAPPQEASEGQCWVASHVDRSEPSFPRAIWREVSIEQVNVTSESVSGTVPAPAQTDTLGDQGDRSATNPVSTEAMAAMALALLLTRGRAKGLARQEGRALLGRWVVQQGGSASAGLGVEIETLLKKGKGTDDGTAKQGRQRRQQQSNR